MTPDRDAADLLCFSLLLEAHRRWEAGTQTLGSLRALKEWLWFYWLAPRRPFPLIRGKYPAAFNWSEAARRSYAEDPKCALVIDHCEPVHLVIRDLLDNQRGGIDTLRVALETRLTSCVLTKAEDQRIHAAGFGSRRVPGAEHDQWARYRKAGLQIETFGPYTGPGEFDIQLTLL